MLIYNQFQPQLKMIEEAQSPEQPFNRRQVYKNQKLQQLNQIYYCECGKNYLTFSALYLHARNKHEIKLTTKRSSLNCKVEKKEEKIIVTYFINHKTEDLHHSALQSPHKTSLQNLNSKNQRYAPMIQLIDLYLFQEKEPNPTLFSYRKSIIELLCNYFRKLDEMGIENCPTEPENLPLYFNDFISFFLPAAHDQKLISLTVLSQAENEIIRFWRWLREHKHTEAQLLHRTCPAPFLPF